MKYEVNVYKVLLTMSEAQKQLKGYSEFIDCDADERFYFDEEQSAQDLFDKCKGGYVHNDFCQVTTENRVLKVIDCDGVEIYPDIITWFGAELNVVNEDKEFVDQLDCKS